MEEMNGKKRCTGSFCGGINFIDEDQDICHVCAVIDGTKPKPKSSSSTKSKLKKKTNPRKRLKDIDEVVSKVKMDELDIKSENPAFHISKKFQNIDLLDVDALYQEAMLKALESKHKFDPSKGYKYETFISKVFLFHYYKLYKQFNEKKLPTHISKTTEDEEEFDIFDEIGDEKTEVSDKKVFYNQVKEFMEDYFDEDECDIFFERVYGTSREDIAKKFNKKVTAIDSIVNRVKSKLSDEFEEFAPKREQA